MTQNAAEKMVDAPIEVKQFYYTALEVENVRCFKDRQRLNLSDENGSWAKWTVLLGNNGSGKTTLLQCLYEMMPYKMKLMESDKICVRPYLSGNGRISFDKFSRNTGSLFLGIEYIFSTINNKFINDRSGVEIRLLSNHKFISTYGYSKIEEKYYSLFIRKYGQNRLFSNEIGDRKEIDNQEYSLIEEINLLNPEKWLLNADYTASKESKIQERAKFRLKTIQDTLVDLLPDIEEIRIVPPERAKDLPKVEFRTPYGWVKFDQLSLGYRTMMGWVVDLAARMFDHYPESPDPLAEPAIVLVDEIDLHMHPQWQRKIMHHLSQHFQNTQFIVTAHSPLIAQAATDARTNIAVLRREGDQVIIDNNPENIRNWRIDQILSSDLFGVPLRSETMEQLMQERASILAKPHLTAEDTERVRHLEQEIGDPPVGESKTDWEAMQLIRAAAAHLQQGK
ncbi:MAG: AAA family ATPase [Magnetococcus sp. DMHC-1]|nr:AAA family ATPase [Magnetococcales bacterium]